MKSVSGITLVFLFCLLRLTAPAADPAVYLSQVVDEMRKPWPNNRTIHVVCHGHSVPAGYFKTPLVDTFNAYPHLLHQDLKAQYPHAVINVIVTAIGGENSESGAARFDTDVLPHKPDVLLIDYALNDRPIGLDRARAAWESMIRKAQAADIPVILLTPTPDQSAQLDNPEDPLNQHAEQIRRLAQIYGTALADSSKAFAAYTASGGKLEDLMSQVNHPNRKGHSLVAGELIKWFMCPVGGPQAWLTTDHNGIDQSEKFNSLFETNCFFNCSFFSISSIETEYYRSSGLTDYMVPLRDPDDDRFYGWGRPWYTVILSVGAPKD